MTTAAASKISRLLGSYDFAREELAKFTRTRDRLAHTASCKEALARGEDPFFSVDDLADDLADAEDEVAAAAERAERARASLAHAEAEAHTA